MREHYNSIEESDETNNKASAAIPGRQPKKTAQAEAKMTAKEREKAARKVSGVDITPADFDIRLYEKQGLCQIKVSIHNQSNVNIPKFKLRFYRGDPKKNLDEAGNVHSGWHEAGPIEPGKSWNELTRTFHLADGQYEFNIVLDYDNSVSEIDENNNRAVLQVRIENGRIVEKSAKDKTDVQVEAETIEQQKPQIGTTGLVGYWSFDGNANDRNGRYNGIVHGATLTEGISGQAYHFDNDDYISIEGISLGAFSFSAWVKTETENLNNRRIFLLDQGSKYYALQANIGGGLSFGIAGGTHEGDIEVNEYDWRFEPGKWTHIVVTFDGSTAKIYKDGRLTETGTITEGRLKGTAYIGGTTSHRGAFWQGAIDEVAIFDGVLSAEEIDRLYNAIRPSVRLVIGENRMTFEGKDVTWEQLPALLEKIPNRGNTVFELAVSTKDMPLSRYDAARGRASKLVERFGFEYLSYVGQHPLGSKAGQKPNVQVEVERR